LEAPSGQQTWGVGNKEENQNGQLLHLYILIVNSSRCGTSSGNRLLSFSVESFLLCVRSGCQFLQLQVESAGVAVAGGISCSCQFQQVESAGVQQLQKNMQHARLVSLHWPKDSNADFLTETVEYDPAR